MDSLGISGPVAAINAGWQEREADDGELLSLLGGRGINLRLHARWMDVLAVDPDYARAEREHRTVVDETQQLYRLRLDYAMRAVYEIAQRGDGHPRVRESALGDALATVRQTDELHIGRVRQLREAFDAAWEPSERGPIAKHQHEVHDVLAGAECLCIAGGHVGAGLSSPAPPGGGMGGHGQDHWPDSRNHGFARRAVTTSERSLTPPPL